MSGIYPIWYSDRYKAELKTVKERYNIPVEDERFDHVFMEGWIASLKVMRESLGKISGEKDDG